MNTFPASLLLIVTLLTPAWSVDSPAVPLSIFGLQAGQEVSIAGTTVLADAAGLRLPIGKPVDLAWKTQGKEVLLTVTSIDSSSGPSVPAWVVDEPTIQPDGSIIAVGKGYAQTVTMARVKASHDARSQALRATPGEVTVKVSGETGSEGDKQGLVESHSSETRVVRNGTVSSQPTDCVITVCADPASAPPVPTKPGVALRPSDRPGDAPVRCWIRVRASVSAAPPRAGLRSHGIPARTRPLTTSTSSSTRRCQVARRPSRRRSRNRPAWLRAYRPQRSRGPLTGASPPRAG